MTPTPHADDPIRRLARIALTLAVRGRSDRGGPWGEAALAEFGHTRGRWEAIRWSAGGIRAASRERRAQRRQAPRRVRIRRRAIAMVVIGVLAAAGIQRWALTPRYEPSAAMAPTLHTADYWLMDRISFRIAGLHYGDIVAFQETEDKNQAFTAVRRVVGLPGDTISCRDDQLFRNGNVIPEPYLPARLASAATACEPLTVPPGSVYLLGDNRLSATEGNPVAANRIEGRLLTRLWNAGPDAWWAPPASVAEPSS